MTRLYLYGAFQYLSPERARGLPHDTRKSDVWSLGITFFEILVGRTPFEHSDGEQFSSNEDLEKYWSRTVRTSNSQTQINFLTKFNLASRQMGRQLEVLKENGEALATDDFAQCRPALYSDAGYCGFVLARIA